MQKQCFNVSLEKPRAIHCFPPSFKYHNFIGNNIKAWDCFTEHKYSVRVGTTGFIFGNKCGAAKPNYFSESIFSTTEEAEHWGLACLGKQRLAFKAYKIVMAPITCC